jgi:hypothetical protein
MPDSHRQGAFYVEQPTIEPVNPRLRGCPHAYPKLLAEGVPQWECPRCHELYCLPKQSPEAA